MSDVKSFTEQITNKLSKSINQPCVLCGAKGHEDLCLCEDCLAELPYIENSCDSCGLPLQASLTHCGACISSPPPCTRCVSVLHYQEPVDYLIKHMKYHNQLAIADLMGKLLVKKIGKTTPLPEQIIPVPLHFSRLQQRGYNQAIEIAKPISRAFNIPINTTLCSRIRDTAPQFDLASDKRAENLSHAFEVINEVSVKHVAIVDDVMTTGCTVWELSKTLINAGVERVDVWTAARATAD